MEKNSEKFVFDNSEIEEKPQRTPEKSFQELPGGVLKKKSGRFGGHKIEGERLNKYMSLKERKVLNQRKTRGIQVGDISGVELEEKITKKYERQAKEYNEKRKREEK